MSKELHAELLTSILLKLPIKTIINCSLVCKTWYNLITSPTFITTHHNFNNTTPLLLTRGRESSESGYETIERFALHHDNETFDLHSKFEFPLKSSSNGYFHIIGCCNGLICLCDDYYTCNLDRIILWNPSIKKAVYLPEPIYVHPVHQYLSSPKPSLGFGFDFAKCDYKLVKITHVDLNAICPKVEVYRLSIRIWEDISRVAPRCYIIEKSIGSYVNGAVHWIGWDWGHKYMIVLFDMRTEVFREMTLPSSLANFRAWNNILLFDCQGSMGLVHRNGDSRSDIWLMKEYGAPESWIRRYSIDNSRAFWRSLGFRDNGDMLCTTALGSLVTDHPKKKQLKKSIRRYSIDNRHPCCASYYIESLALLDSGPNIIYEDAFD